MPFMAGPGYHFISGIVKQTLGKDGDDRGFQLPPLPLIDVAIDVCLTHGGGGWVRGWSVIPILEGTFSALSKPIANVGLCLCNFKDLQD